MPATLGWPAAGQLTPAARLQAVLREAGIRVWRDTSDLSPGQDWRAEIRKAITRDALVFVACFSQRSISRGRSHQNEELVLAVEELRLRRADDLWLIPVRFDDCAIPDLDIGGGRTLASIQRADLFGEHAQGGIAKLVGSIVRMLEHRQGSAGDGADRAATLSPVPAQPACVPDPARVELLEQADRIARRIVHPQLREGALADVADGRAALEARTAAVSNPGRAEHLAHAMTNPKRKVATLAHLAMLQADHDRYRAACMVDAAERAIAGASGDVEPALARIRLADMVSAFDPDRAALLADEAERMASYIRSPDTRRSVLTDLAATASDRDPRRAARLTDEISRSARSTLRRRSEKIRALLDAARALAQECPACATRLTGDARAVAGEFRDGRKQQWLLVVAGTEASTDLVGAERLLGEVRNAWQGLEAGHLLALALAAMAAAAARRDQARSKRWARQAEAAAAATSDPEQRNRVRADVAEILSACNLGRAEHVARAIRDQPIKENTLARIADRLSRTEPGRARQIAEAIQDDQARTAALTAVAANVAPSDLSLAEQIARDIADEPARMKAMAQIAVSAAISDLSGAERIAADISDVMTKHEALRSITAALVSQTFE